MRYAYFCFQKALQTRSELFSIEEPRREVIALSALRDAVRYAAQLPFWADRFRQARLDVHGEFGFADFAAVPALERAEIADAGDAMLSPTVTAHLRRKMATGGSSGTPTVTWTGPLERGWGESAVRFFDARIGLHEGDRVALLWGHNLDPVSRASRKEQFEDWMLNRKWFDCFRLSPQLLLEYHLELTAFRPAFVQAYASALFSLAEAVRDTGLSLPVYPTHGFVTGAEKVYDWQRHVIEEVFGKPVYERYGGRDIGLIAVQLDPRASRRFVVDWPNVHAEIANGGEEGELLVTKLHADAMPLLRYRSGDMIRSAGATPGVPLTSIDEILGRTLQRIWLPNGTWMHGTVVPHLLKDFALRKYQLRQAADYSTELLVVTQDSFDSTQEQDIMTALRRNLPGVPIVIHRVAEIPATAAGKWLPVVSEIRERPIPSVTAGES
jgi:phenylacetate-CoA ligase